MTFTFTLTQCDLHTDGRLARGHERLSERLFTLGNVHLRYVRRRFDVPEGAGDQWKRKGDHEG